MRDLPAPETAHSEERDHGELLRASPRHLPLTPFKVADHKVLVGVVAAVAALATTAAAVVAAKRKPKLPNFTHRRATDTPR